MTGDPNIWVTILLSDKGLFTRKTLSKNWIACISLFIVCTSLFASIRKEGIHAFSECVNVLHLQSHGRYFLPVPWFSSSQWAPKKKSSHSACPLWHAFPKLVSSCWGQPSPHWCLQGRLGISIPLSLPFSLLCCSTLNLQLNGNGSGHVSFWVSQNTHFFMSASLLKCVDRASILSSHYHSVLMSNWQMPVSKTSQ